MRKRTEHAADAVSKNAIHLSRSPRWEKLDNTAHLFPFIAGERTSNVYRISVTLSEAVQEATLQRALDIILPKFPSFDLRLRRGFFWNYFEENGKRAPRVHREDSFPCRYIYSNRNNSYLFRVSYYKYRINLEVAHVLTDGMGAIGFLKELTYQYLRLCHGELAAAGDALSSSTTMNREDSFLKNYKRPSKAVYQRQRAYLIRGDRLRHGEFGVIHGYLRLPALKELCREKGVSINEYLTAAFVWSVYTQCLHRTPSKAPIRVAVPVNLRPYFGSHTTKNFFVMVSAEFHPTKEDYDFSEVLAAVCDSLRSQLTGEHLERIFSYNVSNQENLLLRLVPLPIKALAMRHVYRRSALANTSTVTNIGALEVAEPYRPYIEQFHAVIAISKGQHVKGAICSYGDTLVFTFSSDLADASVQRGFFRRLSEDGLQVEIESNGVNYG